jgi:hypothetical protein
MSRRFTRVVDVKRPSDLAQRMAERQRARLADGYKRVTFTLPREKAREKARELLTQYPRAAYGTEIESWSVLPGDVIEFTVRRLPTAD